MDDDADGFQRDPEQVMGLDHLQALVHQGRRVDRDLGPHRPPRVVERLLHRHLVQVEVGMRPERAAARRDDQAPDVLALLAPQALPDGAVLTVDRPYAPGPGGLHDQRPGHDQDLFGGQRDLLAGLQRRHGGLQRTRAGDRDHDQVAASVPDHGLDLVVELGVAGLAAHEVLSLAIARMDAFGEAEELEPVGVAVDDVQRLPADGTGGAEDHDIERPHQLEKMKDSYVEPDQDRRKEDGVDPVEDPAMAGDEVRGILHLSQPLHLRLDQVPHLGAGADQETQDETVNRGQPEHA